MKSENTWQSGFEDDPDCGIDAASDRGYWLEKCDKRTKNRLIKWRKKAGMSSELLSQMVRMSLVDYLLIESDERPMTQGDAWRIDAAIIDYRRSTVPVN